MAPEEASLAAGDPGDALTLLYGSQTGTAEEVAWDLAREGQKRGFQCSDPRVLNDVDVQGLAKLGTAVFVVSTTGQGDPPVNMRRLWQELLAASLPKALLAGLRFAVFGLGDSHYREFNYAARKLHARLQQLGGQPFFRLGLGDDQHDFGLEQELDPWAEAMWAALADLRPPRVPAEAPGSRTALQDRRYDVEVLEEGGPKRPPGSTCRLVSRCDEFEATVWANWSLCAEEHARVQQDVRNICLQMPVGRCYDAGDVCLVWPRADPVLVERFVVETLSLSLQTVVRIFPAQHARVAGPAASSTFPDTPLTLEEIFTSYVDISAVPSRHFFHVLSQYTDHELHKKKLTEFASRTLEAKDALYEYCKREKRSAAEVMWDFWTARPPLAELLSCLPPMRPRRYSIASCPRWYEDGAGLEKFARFWMGYLNGCGPAWRAKLQSQAAFMAGLAALRDKQVHGRTASQEGCRFDLCVAVVRFTTKTGREGHGLCSTFLQQAAVGSRMLCSIERGTLTPPPLSVPVILICPGTGLSPCRALVQERHLDISKGGTARGRFQAGLKDLMFLGFRHRDGDFLYGDEWSAYDEWLAVHVAFSRDHADRKVYVQDCIEEHGPEVCNLLDAGAQVFVCGRAHPMPSQVFDAFVEVLHVHRGLSVEDATARLRELQRAQRYVCDTWG